MERPHVYGRRIQRRPVVIASGNCGVPENRAAGHLASDLERAQAVMLCAAVNLPIRG
jgi:hypothetical protein